MYFSDVIGHSDTIKNLIKVINSKNISHAYIFDGCEGIGKSMVASVFASGILCENFSSDNCGKCKNCRLTFNNSHPDLKILDLTVSEDGMRKNSISVESIRNLKKDIYLKPFFAERKIYILENADKMTVEAQNAMLKIFEEPPSYITIILITNGISKILETIKSRAVIVKFSSLKPKELELYLSRYYNNTDNKEIFASISDGSVKKMLSLIEDKDSLEFRKSVIEGINELVKIGVSTSYNKLFKIFLDNKDNKDEIINMFLVFMMDIIYIKLKNDKEVKNIDIKDEVKEISKNISVASVYNVLNHLFELSKKLQSNGNYKLDVLSTLLKIWEELHG